MSKRSVCPLCAGEKSSHQPICYACATSKARVEEAYQQGLITSEPSATEMATAARRRMLMNAAVNFWHCPNSQVVLMSEQSDDKVMCPCGRTNPRVAAAGHREVDPQGGHAHHLKRFLRPASVDEYLAARERREAW